MQITSAHFSLYRGAMFRTLRLIAFIVLTNATAEAQGNLTELFTILRTEGPKLTESDRARTFQILEPYGTGKKSIDGEWQVMNDALNDSSPFVRDQACAALAAIVYVSSTPVYANPPRLNAGRGRPVEPHGKSLRPRSRF